jgi:large repetitive protein
LVQQLVYSSFLGGSGNDATWWLDNRAVDEIGNICLAIDTDSKDFPVTEDAYHTTYNGGNQWGMDDIAVVKFSIENNRLEYSAYFGGSGMVLCGKIAVDDKGCVYVIGTTYSTDFPVTQDSFDKTFNGGEGDGRDDIFVAKLNSDESDLVYSTYIGGSTTE